MKAEFLIAASGYSLEKVSIEDRDERVDWMNDRGFEGEARTFPKVYTVDYRNRETLIGGFRELSDLLEGKGSRDLKSTSGVTEKAD